jgi:hypothetical protein
MVRLNARGGIGMILNIDGSSIDILGVLGFRGYGGEWVHSFAENIRFLNILHAKLLAVYHWLVLAWELDIKDLWCYSDFIIVIKLLSDHINE